MKNINIANGIFYTILFAIFFVFFSQIHPLLPFDTDDWLYSGFARPPYPSIYQWNPTKILPECLQPTIAMIAAYVVTPIIGDYLNALVVSHSIVISMFITIYLFSVQKLLEWRYKTSYRINFCIILVYTLLHFLILRISDSNNDYLWYSRDVNCYYNYLIPNMLNASLVLWLMRHDLRKITQSSNFCILLFITFLALFSNLYSTVILIAYVGSVLLLDLFDYKKGNGTWLKDYIKDHTFYLISIIIWIIVQWFEVNGNRANAYGYTDISLVETIKKTIKYLLLLRFNLWFIIITLGAIIGAKIYDYIKGEHRIWHIGKLNKIIILSFALSLTYLILLSSQVRPIYIIKSDVIISYVFFYLLLFVLAICFLCTKTNLAKTIMPLLIFFILVTINTKGNVFKDVQYWNGTDLYTCEKFDRDVIRQVQNADTQGLDSLVIYVHKYKDGLNWPQDFDHSEYIGLTLQKHGIIKKKITTIYEYLPAELDKR